MIAELERQPNARVVLGPAIAPGGAPSHAYLFHGPGGSGKRAAARAIAAELLAAGSADVDGARARALHGSHPDLTWVSPSGAHEMLVSDIDGPVVSAASKTPFESARRVFVIEGVDRLGDDAANRMLKTLEEPASFVHLILITDRLAEVLPTIRSRCQIVRFDAPPIDAVIAELAAGGVPLDTASGCARLALGDPSRAHELASPEGAAVREAAEAFARAVLDGGVAGSAPWVAIARAVAARGDRVVAEIEERSGAELELMPRKERKRAETEWGERAKRMKRRAETGALDLALSLVASWLLDLFALGYGAEDLVRNVDRRAALGEHEGRSSAALRSGVELIEDTRVRFVLNVNVDLALEALAYRLERALAA